MKPTTHESGQILLISLLVLSVATTIALSLVGRTATDQNITNEIQEGTQAFYAAEAGIEQALKSGVGSGGTQVLSPSVSYTTTVSSVGGGIGPYVFVKKTPENSGTVVWLVNHTGNGSLNLTPTYTRNSLDVCWNTDTTTPAIATTILYRRASDGSVQVASQTFDPNSSRAGTNHFTTVGAPTGGCGQSGFYKATLTFPALGITPTTDTLIALRLLPLYADAQFAVDSGNASLPLQGMSVESSGMTGTGVTKKIVVVTGFRVPSVLFDAGVVSQSSFGH